MLFIWFSVSLPPIHTPFAFLWPTKTSYHLRSDGTNSELSKRAMHTQRELHHMQRRVNVCVCVCLRAFFLVGYRVQGERA